MLFCRNRLFPAVFLAFPSSFSASDFRVWAETMRPFSPRFGQTEALSGLGGKRRNRVLGFSEKQQKAFEKNNSRTK
jgi:hypothetical protein